MKFRFKGLDQYIKKLEKLSNPYHTQLCVYNAVTEGAKVVSEMTMEELKKLPVDNSRPHDGTRKSINQLQKNALIDAWGITPLEEKIKLVNRKTGVSRGTNKIKTKAYPNGQPHVTIARRLENGTSYMPKNPVFSRASRKARKPCLETMQKSLNRDIESIMR